MMKVLLVFLLVLAMQNAEEETSASLKRNIMYCSFSNPLNPGAAPSDINVSLIPPSASALETYLSQRSTLTASNANILFSANIKGYHDKWATDKQNVWTIPDEHPGQNKSMCLNLLKTSQKGTVERYYDQPKMQMRQFYMLTTKNAFIHPTGMLGLPCGYYIGLENCENRFVHVPLDWQWQSKCVPYLKTQKGEVEWQEMWNHATNQADGFTMENTTLLDEYCRYREDRATKKERTIFPRKYKKVFVMSALWDYNYHHFVADSLARGVHHYKFLRENVDVMIHLREFEQYSNMIISDPLSKLNPRRMRENLLTIWGINASRVVSGPIVAEKVYVPRPTACSNTLMNPLEIRALAKQLLKGAHKMVPRSHKTDSHPHGADKPVPSRRLLAPVDADRMQMNSTHRDRKKVMIIQQRHTQGLTNDRQWTNATFESVVQAFQQMFPDHSIVRMSNVCEKWGTCCPACEMIKYSHADVLVGVHGAGLTNQMFMQPNSLIVEIVGDFKDVNMPVCGYYGTLAAVMGNHHYIYTYVHPIAMFMVRKLAPDEKLLYRFKPEDAAAGARKLYQQIHSNSSSSTG